VARIWLIAAATGIAFACPGMPPCYSDELPLTQVVLSSSGLAQFTHAGAVKANSSVALQVRLDQVDDILKSLTIFDQPNAIGSVSLPGKTPISELFRDLPFDQNAFASRSALLQALIGTEVELSGTNVAKGLLFRVEDEAVPLPNSAATTTRHRISLLTDKGLVQAVLEDVSELRFTDPKINAAITLALKSLIANQAKDSRQLSIRFRGEGTRNVAVSYVLAAPIWKTSYRLVVPKDEAKARLQGWAILEHLTGGNWNDVEINLVSGNPVALRERLYDPFYVWRPEVPVENQLRLIPRVDDAAPGGGGLGGGDGGLGRGGDGLGAMVPAALASSKMFATSVSRVRDESPGPLSLGGAANAAEAEEASTQLIYRYPEKVTLAAGDTMMLPFADREVRASRVWLFQPKTSSVHPLTALRLQNDGDTGLPAGIVTAYDAAPDGRTDFVGDAQLPLLPKSAVKIVPFALDAKTDIRREDGGIHELRLGKIVGGNLVVSTRSSHAVSYEVTPPLDEDRLILVEEERIDGWKPVAATKDLEETPTRYRYTINAPKGHKTTATFTTARVENESFALAEMTAENLLFSLRGLQNDGSTLAKAVQQLSNIVIEISRLRSERQALDNERSAIATDQARIRENLQSIGQSSDLGHRYIGNITAQEDRLDTISRSMKELDSAIEAKQKQAADIAQDINL
jgi:hypothetical protein